MELELVPTYIGAVVAVVVYWQARKEGKVRVPGSLFLAFCALLAIQTTLTMIFFREMSDILLNVFLGLFAGVVVGAGLLLVRLSKPLKERKPIRKALDEIWAIVLFFLALSIVSSALV